MTRPGQRVYNYGYLYLECGALPNSLVFCTSAQLPVHGALPQFRRHKPSALFPTHTSPQQVFEPLTPEPDAAEVQLFKMKAIQLQEYVKGPEGLVVSDLPEPVPGEDELLIEIHSSATNFFDILQIQGKYQTQPPFPWIAGFEFAGVVLSAPSDSKWKKGDRVFGGSQGAYAERIVLPDIPGTLLPIPADWSFVDACGLFVTAPTSYLALTTRANLKAGEICLVHAAAGGVGLAAVQIAKALGATVIATAGTPEKLAVAKRFGADHGVNYTDKDWIQQVKDITDDAGCDVIYDPVGMIDQSLKVVAWNGRICVIGFAAGKIEKIAMNKGTTIIENCRCVLLTPHSTTEAMFDRWRILGRERHEPPRRSARCLGGHLEHDAIWRVQANCL